MRFIYFDCDYCGGPGKDRRSEYVKKRRHFCKRECYTLYRTEIMPPEEQNSWKGGISPKEAQRAYNLKNQEKLKAMRKARRLREQNAPGSHTPQEWEAVKEKQGHRCAEPTCLKLVKLTKDHIVPLIMGGSDDIDNIQGLCTPCNSRKSRRVYLETLPTSEK